MKTMGFADLRAGAAAPFSRSRRDRDGRGRRRRARARDACIDTLEGGALRLRARGGIQRAPPRPLASGAGAARGRAGDRRGGARRAAWRSSSATRPRASATRSSARCQRVRVDSRESRVLVAQPRRGGAGRLLRGRVAARGAFAARRRAQRAARHAATTSTALFAHLEASAIGVRLPRSRAAGALHGAHAPALRAHAARARGGEAAARDAGALDAARGYSPRAAQAQRGRERAPAAPSPRAIAAAIAKAVLMPDDLDQRAAQRHARRRARSR